MTKNDIIEFIGRMPDKITNKSMLDEGVWKCSKCGNIKSKSKEPCKCGSIFWEKVIN